MVAEIKRLTDAGVDGVVFLAEAPLGMYDGFTPGAVEMFNKTFHARINPYTLFENGTAMRHSQFSPDKNQHGGGAPSEASEFWRWTGWKARQRLTVLQDLMDTVREHKPEIHFGLELHPESIEDPLGALTQFSEDFLEATQRDFRFFMVAPQTLREIELKPPSLDSIDLEEFVHQSRILVDRMNLVLQNPARVWLPIPWGKKTPGTLASDSAKTGHLHKVSQIYDLQIFLDK